MWLLYINLVSKYILENHINIPLYFTGSGVASIPNILSGVVPGLLASVLVLPATPSNPVAAPCSDTNSLLMSAYLSQIEIRRRYDSPNVGNRMLIQGSS